MVEWFFSKVDISDNIAKALRGVAKIPPGMASKVFAWMWCFPIMVFSGAFAWYFDISSTWEFSRGVSTLIAASLPPWMAAIGPIMWLVIVILSLSPTVMEMGGAFFARLNIWFFQVMVWFFVAFDLFTDGPRVTEFLAIYQASLYSIPWIGGPVVYWTVWFFFLLLGSYGFELIFVVAAVSFAALLRKSKVAEAATA
jgi:hypothetical protein